MVKKAQTYWKRLVFHCVNNCVFVSNEGMINEKCVVRLPHFPSPQNPPLANTHNHTKIQEATVHVFAMADRKGFKEWGKSLRKKDRDINQEKRKKNMKRKKEKEKRQHKIK